MYLRTIDPNGDPSDTQHAQAQPSPVNDTKRLYSVFCSCSKEKRLIFRGLLMSEEYAVSPCLSLWCGRHLRRILVLLFQLT